MKSKFEVDKSGDPSGVSLEQAVVDDFNCCQVPSLLCHVQLNLGSLPDGHWLPGNGVAQAHHASNKAESTSGDSRSTEDGIFDDGRHLQNLLSEQVFSSAGPRRPKGVMLFPRLDMPSSNFFESHLNCIIINFLL